MKPLKLGGRWADGQRMLQDTRLVTLRTSGHSSGHSHVLIWSLSPPPRLQSVCGFRRTGPTLPSLAHSRVRLWPPPFLPPPYPLPTPSLPPTPFPYPFPLTPF